MADFQFRTRGQQSPQGKQRVYFTCHPDDFEKYFEEIQKESLDRQDCAVFYLEPNTQPEDVEDYELRLREMQLFVVPVTTKLLTKANRAMDVEVPFAFENHIPVLPLMQESELDDVFNAKFGDLQYLDKYNTDPTAIPYEEKLTKYLESVIVGDELAKKVRAAFDAYIFLSYRKKDRKYAQELMKLIHSNPLCRDIAIWYDEFLTPGENFNEAIRAALEKSELFALAVTPNLINEINYILTTEYPMACKMGKKILPVEMLKTSSWRFKRQYKRCPKPINHLNVKGLQDKLIELLESIAIRKNDTDPQHNFFIGLAYLGGIDVEVNHERAVSLITSSAEQGYIPAIEKLVTMYSNGESVKRNYNEATKWRENLVEQRKNIYEANPIASNAKEYIIQLCDLGDAYYMLGQISISQNTYAEMCRIIEQISLEFVDDDITRYQCVSYSKLGDIAEAQGELNKAKEWYLKSLSIAELLSKETNTAVSRHNLSADYNRLGDIAKAQGELNEAKKWFFKSLEIFEYLEEETKSVYSRYGLVIVYNRLGDIDKTMGKLIEAEEWYRKSLSVAEPLAMEINTIKSLQNLSYTYERLGDIAQTKGMLNEAEKWFRMKLAVDAPLANETNIVESLRNLSITYERLGDINLKRGNLIKAEEWYWKSYKIFDSICNEINNIKSRRSLSVSYEKLGDVSSVMGKISKAEELYQKALYIREALVEEIGTAESYDDLATSYFKLGALLSERIYLDKALDIWSQLAEQFHNNPTFQQKISIVKDAIHKLFN